MRKLSSLSNLLSTSIALFLLSSCQKEPAADTTPETACKLTKAYYFDEIGTLADSLVYTYTNNKISKAANADGHIAFAYSDDKITKRSFYDASSQQQDAYDVATYNSDGTLKTIKKYYSFGNQTIPYDQYDFIYSGNKLVKFEVKYYNTTTSQYELYETTTYTYTGDNITQSITDPSSTSLSDTLNYAHDTNKNYFTKSNAFFFEFAFMEEISGSVIPLIMSSNNVISVYEDGDEFPLAYKVDDKNNFSEWYLDGRLGSRYLYDCK